MPDLNQTIELTPQVAADAASGAVIRAQSDEARKRYEDSLDIRDPSVAREPETPKPATPSEPRGIPSAKVDPFQQDHLERARRLGISDDEARQTPPGVLRMLEESQGGQAWSDAEPPEFQQPAFKFDPYTGQPVQRQPAPPQPPKLPSLRDWKGPNGEEFEEPLIQAIEERDKFYQTQLEQQNKLLQEQREAFQRQQQAAQARESQQAFNRIETLIGNDADMQSVFGAGPAHRVAPHQLNARAELATTVDSLADGYVRRGLAPPPLESLYEMAKRAIYHEQLQSKQADRTIDRLRASNGQFIAKPTATNRNSDLPPGEDRAVRAVANLMRQQNRWPG